MVYASYFEHEVEEGHSGFCQKFTENGYGVIDDELIRMVVYLLSFFMLAWWIRGSYAGNTSGFYSSNDQIIFPIHLKVLGLLTVSMFFESLFTVLYELKPFGTNNTILSVLSIFCLGLSSALLGGITMLLISAAIGHRAMKRAIKVGIVCGIVTIVCNLLIIGSEDTVIVEVLVAIWEFVILIVLCSIWMAPKCGLLSFRPAAIFWCRFWAFFRIMLIVSFFLIELKVDIGICLYHFSNYLFYSLLNVWVVYQAFVLEAQWWHGMYVHQSKSTNKTVINLLNKLCCFSNDNIMNEIDDHDMNYAEENGNAQDINFAFSGIELSGASAQAMSEVLDTYRRTRATSNAVDVIDISSHSSSSHGYDRTRQTRGSSSSISQSNKSDSHQASSFGSRALSSITPSFTHRTSSIGARNTSVSSIGNGGGMNQKLIVPLIDFTKLKMLSNRMLGTGSSARVYEGRWHGKVCAVKVLFTVEITPDEIKRTCHEASLLHHLCKHSQHVVRLFGVAVLPPSLCVVLEYCNGGSLYDILYTESDTIIEASSSFTSSFSFSRTASSRNLKAGTSSSSMKQSEMSSIRNSTNSNVGFINRLSFSLDALRSSEVTSSSFSNPDFNMNAAAGSGGNEVVSRLGEITPEFKHPLPWLHRLDLAYGASLGLEAISNHLPGFSHNDIKSANFLVHINQVHLASSKVRIPSSTTSTLLQHQQQQVRKSIGNNSKHMKGVGLNNSSEHGGGGGDTYNDFMYCVKVADMEFASKNITPPHMKNGDTPNWIAPEVLSGSNVSNASDMYALANVLYEIETRQIPFHDISKAQEIRLNIKAGKRPKFTPLFNTTDKSKKKKKKQYDHQGVEETHLNNGSLVADGDGIEPSAQGADMLDPSSSTRSSTSTPIRKEEEEEGLEMRSMIQIEEYSRLEFRKLVESCWSQDPLERTNIHSLASALYELRRDFISDMKTYESTRENMLKGGLSDDDDDNDDATVIDHKSEVNISKQVKQEKSVQERQLGMLSSFGNICDHSKPPQGDSSLQQEVRASLPHQISKTSLPGVII